MATETDPDVQPKNKNLLLTPKMIRSLKAVFNLGYSSCLIPFGWNEVEQMHGAVEHRRVKHFYFNVCVNAFHATWLSHQAWEMRYQQLENSQVEQLALFAYVALCANSLFYQISLIFFGEDLKVVLFRTLKFLGDKNAELNVLGINKRSWEIMLADFLLSMVCPSLLLSFLSVPILAILSPSSPILTLPRFPCFRTGFGLLLSVLFELYIALFIAATTGVYLWSGVVAAFGLLAAFSIYLNDIRCQGGIAYRFLHDYREYQILVNSFNNAYSSIVFPDVVCAGIIISVLGFFSAIRLAGPTGISSGVVACMVLVTVLISLRATAEFHRKSVNVLRILRSSVRQRRDIGQLELKALQPIRVKISNYFYIDTKFTLVVLGIVIINVGNLLIAI